MMIPGMPITGQPPALGSIGAMMQSGMLLPSQQQPLTIAPLPGGQTPQQMGAMQMGFMPDGSQPLTSLPQPIDSLTSPLLHTAPLSMPAPGFPIASNDGSLPTSIPTAGLGLQTGEDGTPHAGTESGLGGPNMTTAAPRIPGQQGQDNNPQAPTGLGSKGPEAGSHGALSEFARSLSLGVSVPSPGLEGTSATGELLGMPPNLHPSTGDLAGLLPTLSPARGMMGPPSSSARADGQAQVSNSRPRANHLLSSSAWSIVIRIALSGHNEMTDLGRASQVHALMVNAVVMVFLKGHQLIVHANSRKPVLLALHLPENSGHR